MSDPTGEISGLRQIAASYDAVLSDVWGVVHNGVAAHPTAVEALANFRGQGGRVVLITNAPRASRRRSSRCSTASASSARPTTPSSRPAM